MTNPTLPALLAALLLPFTASAQDGKGYAGATCQSSLSSNNTSIGSGRRYNLTAGVIDLYCPLVNDSIGGDYVDNGGVLWFLDRSSSGYVSCTQYTRIQTGSSVSGFSAAGSYPGSAGIPTIYASATPTKMTFNGTLGTSDVRSQATWSYFVCSTPGVWINAASGVVAYYAEEN